MLSPVNDLSMIYKSRLKVIPKNTILNQAILILYQVKPNNINFTNISMLHLGLQQS